MATWSKKIRACKTVWSTLRVLNQLRAVFDEAGVLKMSDLTLWKKTQSGQLSADEQEGLAIQMDNTFRLIRRATYEDGYDKPKAIDAIKLILGEKEKTVADLAEISNDAYSFLDEANDIVAAIEEEDNE